MPIFYAMLPMLILAISLCILDLVNTHKVWIFILPVIVCALFLYHPDIASAYGFSTLFSKNAVMALQIILVALWLMILLGGNRIAGLATRHLLFRYPFRFYSLCSALRFPCGYVLYRMGLAHKIKIY